MLTTYLIQIHFRMHHIVVKFSKNFFALGGNGALTPPNQNPADVPGPPSLCRICCVRIVSSTHHGRGSNRPHSVAAIGDSHDCWSTELANAGKSPTRRRPQDCETFRIPSSLSNRTIRIRDEEGWSDVGGTCVCGAAAV